MGRNQLGASSAVGYGPISRRVAWYARFLSNVCFVLFRFSDGKSWSGFWACGVVRLAEGGLVEILFQGLKAGYVVGGSRSLLGPEGPSINQFAPWG